MAEKKKLSRRMSALLWLVGAAIVIGILIALHQIAVIYLIATVALVVLLLIVAYSDLENIDRQDILGSEMD
ncbi:MAG: hypothetical protein KF762_02330 [Acidobacteria bacterium]|nr:hypothetical protein [Acidobacteriota bacterium]